MLVEDNNNLSLILCTTRISERFILPSVRESLFAIGQVGIKVRGNYEVHVRIRISMIICFKK